MDTKYCPACGAAQDAENAFCTYCGHALDAPAPGAEDAALLPGPGRYHIMLTAFDGTPEKAAGAIAETCGYTYEDALAIAENLPTLVACDVTLVQARAIRAAFFEDGLTVRVYDSAGNTLVDTGAGLPGIYETAPQGSFLGNAVTAIRTILASITMANRVRRAAIRPRPMPPPPRPKRPVPRLRFSLRRPDPVPRPRAVQPRAPQPRPAPRTPAPRPSAPRPATGMGRPAPKAAPPKAAPRAEAPRKYASPAGGRTAGGSVFSGARGGGALGGAAARQGGARKGGGKSGALGGALGGIKGAKTGRGGKGPGGRGA